MKDLGKFHVICDEMDRNIVEILGVYERNWTNKDWFFLQEKAKEWDTAIAKILSNEPVRLFWDIAQFQTA